MMFVVNFEMNGRQMFITVVKSDLPEIVIRKESQSVGRSVGASMYAHE